MSFVKSLIIIISLTVYSYAFSQSTYDSTTLSLAQRVKGNITPKSVVYGKDKLFAQNMMYKHSITIYDTSGALLKTIKDTISPSFYGDSSKLFNYQGSPVEAAITADKKHIWVSNYQMFGEDFKQPGCDACNKKNTYDYSYLYAVNTKTLKVDKLAKTGSVPKFVACSPDGLLLAVSNWSDGTVSILNQYNGAQLKSIDVGRHPRGLVFNKTSTRLYVAVMGADKLVDINLSSGEKRVINTVGNGPRHLLYADSTLYVTLNNEGKIKKWDIRNNTWTAVKVGIQPRSMTFSKDSAYLYAVNYKSNTVSKVSVRDMKVTQTVKTDDKPIGITTEPVNNSIWVACYSGSLLRFTEKNKAVYIPDAIASSELKEHKKTIYSPKKTALYHVIVGSFPTINSAKKHGKKLEAKGYKTMVLKRNKGRYRVSAFWSADSKKTTTEMYRLRKTLRKDAWMLKVK